MYRLATVVDKLTGDDLSEQFFLSFGKSSEFFQSQLAQLRFITTCPFCFKMYDGRQRAIKGALKDASLDLPVFYYTQLLGLAMGLGPEKLGLDLNLSPIDPVLERIREG